MLAWKHKKFVGADPWRGGTKCVGADLFFGGAYEFFGFAKADYLMRSARARLDETPR